MIAPSLRAAVLVVAAAAAPPAPPPTPAPASAGAPAPAREPAPSGAPASADSDARPEGVDVLVSATAGLRRLVVRTDDQGERVELRVLDADGTLLQSLPIETQEPAPAEDEGLRIGDLDGDGHQDVKLRSWAGATGNQGFLGWRFDPAAEAFVEIAGFDQLSNPQPDGRGCLDTHEAGGHAGMIFTDQRWCWLDGRLELRRTERQESLWGGGHLRVTLELRDGQMVEIERRVVEEIGGEVGETPAEP